MDPNACIDHLHDIVVDAEADTDEAQTAILDLRDWFKIGGFPPDGAHVDVLARVCLNLIKERP